MRIQIKGVGAITVLIVFIMLQFILLINPNSPKASDTPHPAFSSAEPSFQAVLDADKVVDMRVLKLTTYLESKNSPMAPYARKFVMAADKYSVDWKLVPSISGIESNFGKYIPVGSYNAYGWANGTYYFQNWEDGIEIVTRDLRQKYIDRGAVTVEQISYIYVPPNHRNWTFAVNQFMNEIDNAKVPREDIKDTIDVALKPKPVN